MGCSGSWQSTRSTCPTRAEEPGFSGELGVDTGDPPIVRVISVMHTRGMDVALTKITDSGLLNLITPPMVIATLLVVAAVWSGLAARIALLLEDLRMDERMRC